MESVSAKSFIILVLLVSISGLDLVNSAACFGSKPIAAPAKLKKLLAAAQAEANRKLGTPVIVTKGGVQAGAECRLSNAGSCSKCFTEGIAELLRECGRGDTGGFLSNDCDIGFGPK